MILESHLLDMHRRYEGEWVDDMMTGRGYMVWADGRRYDGEWFENRCNGRGVLTYKDGRRYEVREPISHLFFEIWNILIANSNKPTHFCASRLGSEDAEMKLVLIL
jgi:hypothetical protein